MQSYKWDIWREKLAYKCDKDLSLGYQTYAMKIPSKTLLVAFIIFVNIVLKPVRSVSVRVTLRYFFFISVSQQSRNRKHLYLEHAYIGGSSAIL